MKRAWLAFLLLFTLFGLSACHTDQGIEASSINLDQQVVEGGTAEIDAGYVVNYSANKFGFACWPENQEATGCTIWLAGHHSTHGSVFADVPNLQVGDMITVHHYKDACCFRNYYVTGKTVVSRYDPASWDMISGPLVLQTSYDADNVWLVFAS